MTRRRGAAVWSAFWLAWIAWVAAHYFVRPAGGVLFLDGRLGVPHFWREAAVRLVWAFGGACAVWLAAWGTGSAIARRALGGLFSTPGERLVFTLGLGCGLCAYFLLALAVIHLYRPIVVTTLV